MDNEKFLKKWSETRKRGRLIHNILYGILGSIGAILGSIINIYSCDNYTLGVIIASVIGCFIGGLIGGNIKWNRNEKKYANILRY